MKGKVIDNNGRLFGKISVIDVLVILVVVVAALAIFTKRSGGETPGAQVSLTPVSYDITLRSVRDSAASCLQVGDTVYADGGYDIGKIVAIDMQDSMVISTLVDGKQVVAPAYERYDVTVTIEVGCSISNGRYFANKTFEIGSNAEVKMYTKYNSATSTITRFEPKI